MPSAEVKISLMTGDTATARVRWTEVHPQVEALDQMALLRLNDTGGMARPKPALVRLTPEQIAPWRLDDRVSIRPEPFGARRGSARR